MRTCTQQSNILSYDKMVLQEHMMRKGCIPPYLEDHEGFPICKTQTEIKDAIYSFMNIRKKYIPIACERISRVYHYDDDGYHFKDDSMWAFSMIYPEHIRVITQSKEVDVHSLIGNIGGYVGLFLGDSILFRYA